MTAGMFFLIMAIVGLVLLLSAKNAHGKGKVMLIALGLPILLVSLFGVFTALI